MPHANLHLTEAHTNVNRQWVVQQYQAYKDTWGMEKTNRGASVFHPSFERGIKGHSHSVSLMNMRTAPSDLMYFGRTKNIYVNIMDRFRACVCFFSCLTVPKVSISRLLTIGFDVCICVCISASFGITLSLSIYVLAIMNCVHILHASIRVCNCVFFHSKDGGMTNPHKVYVHIQKI